MSHNNNNHPSYIYQGQIRQNPQSPRTRGEDHTLSQHSPVLVNNITHVALPPRHGYHPVPGPLEEFHPPSVLHSYGFNEQRPGGPSYTLGDNSEIASYNYQSVNDSPTQEPAARYQEVWPAPPGHPNGYRQGISVTRKVWADDSYLSNPESSDRGTLAGNGYELPRQWDGEMHSPFQSPTSPTTTRFLDHHESSDEAAWPFNHSTPVRQDLPSLGDHPRRHEHVQYPSSSSAGTSIHGPFTHFPAQDPVRDGEYAVGHGNSVNESKNTEMLGFSPRADCSCGSTRILSASHGSYFLPSAAGSSRPSDHNCPSPSGPATQGRAEGPEPQVQMSADIEASFPDSANLRALATHIMTQSWFQRNEAEPSIGNDDLVMRLKLSKRMPKSRFDLFFDEKLRCLATEANNRRCEHVATRKDRAAGHARTHFGYKPFACSGKCGNAEWLVHFFATLPQLVSKQVTPIVLSVMYARPFATTTLEERRNQLVFAISGPYAQP